MSDSPGVFTETHENGTSNNGIYLVLLGSLVGLIALFTIGSVFFGWDVQLTIPKVLILGFSLVYFFVMLARENIPIANQYLRQLAGFLWFLACLSLFVF